MTLMVGRTLWVVVALAACGDDGDVLPPDAPVAPDSGPTRTVSITVLEAPGFFAPSLVAVQDGDGIWVALTEQDGAFQAEIANERFGVQAVCVYEDYGFVARDLTLQTVSDGTEVELVPCFGGGLADTFIEIAGTVANAPADAVVQSGWSGGRVMDGAFEVGSYAGPNELLVTGTSGGGMKMLRHDLGNLAFSTSDEELDFAPSETGVERRLAVTGLEATDTELATVATLSVEAGYFELPTPLGHVHPSFVDLPPALAKEADELSIAVYARRKLGGFLWIERSVQSADPTASFALPAVPTFEPAVGGRYGEPIWTWDGTIASPVLASADGDGGFAFVYATPGWLAGASSLSIPNSLVLPGWTPGWNVDANQPWTIDFIEGATRSGMAYAPTTRVRGRSTRASSARDRLVQRARARASRAR